MKTFKKALAFVLVLTMILALSVPAFADGEEVYHYVSLGASNSNGYALHGYLTEDLYANPSGRPDDDGPGLSGYRTTPPYSYPWLMVQYLEGQGYTVDHAQLAQSSMRVEELRFLLDDSFTADEYTKWRFYDENNSGTWWFTKLEQYREDYKKSVAEADLITYDMGLNNFGVYLINRLMSNNYGADFSHILGTEYAERFYALREQLHASLDALTGGALSGKDLEEVESLLDTMAYALLGYIVHFDATMKIIYELNPDVTMVVMSVQNVMADLGVSLKGVELPLGALFGSFVDIANTYMTVGSPYSTRYLVADTRADGRVSYFVDDLVNYNGDPATLTQDMRDCLDAYDTSIPVFLRFRLAADMAVSKGLLPAEYKNRKEPLRSNLPKAVEIAEANFPELYHKALENAYDTLYTFMKAAIRTNPLPIDGVVDGADIGKLEDQLVAEVIDLVAKVADANLYGEGFTEEMMQAEIDRILCDDNMKAVAAIGVRSSIGNTFFSHPSPAGCRELYDSIVYALENGQTGDQAFFKALDDAAGDIIENTVAFGVQFPKLLVEYISSAFGIDSTAAQEIIDRMVNADDIKDLLYNEIGVDNLEKLEDFLAYMQATRAELQRYAPANTPEYLAALSEVTKEMMADTWEYGLKYSPVLLAKVTEAFWLDSKTVEQASRQFMTGNIEGALKTLGITNMENIDILRECMEAAREELNAPRMVKVPAKPASYFLAGNIEYYINLNDGKWYYDEEGLEPIESALDVVVPKLKWGK